MDHNIVFNQVSFTYNANSPFEYQAIYDIDLEIPKEKVTAIIGHTGSGKSTLLQHFNVLVRPTQGTVSINNEQITATSKHDSLKQLRKRVGVVFQFPEAQLFEETVIKDVMFGPLNFDVDELTAQEIAKQKLALVGIDEKFFERSPFDLSGGQMRRVAIAGVLALEPEVLVLDEPTAGLDPQGHHEMLEMFMRLQREQKMTLIMVTHHMEDVVKYADHVVVMHQGTVIKQGTPADIFEDEPWLKQYQLALPQTVAFAKKIESALNIKSNSSPLSIEALVDYLIELKNAGDDHVR